MTKIFAHEPDAGRYTLVVDGELVAVADYRINGDSISFNHTYTEPKRRGHGYAAEVVEFAIDDVAKNSGRRVVPMCWYVADWFDAHPERAELLTR
ncbi:MAG: GNAT family N-acetyltransferase [Rhodoglobus sp.]